MLHFQGSGKPLKAETASHSVCTEHCMILTGATGAHKLNFIHQILPNEMNIHEGTKKAPVSLGKNGLGIFF